PTLRSPSSLELAGREPAVQGDEQGARVRRADHPLASKRSADLSHERIDVVEIVDSEAHHHDRNLRPVAIAVLREEVADAIRHGSPQTIGPLQRLASPKVLEAMPQAFCTEISMSLLLRPPASTIRPLCHLPAPWPARMNGMFV